MLRLKHLLRTHPARPSLFRNSFPVAHLSQASHNNVRHVRFKRPWFRSFLFKCFLYGTAFHLWSSLVLRRFDDEPTVDGKAPHRNFHASHERDGDGVEEAEEEGGSFFIPLGWSRLQPGELYTPADPEYQEFVRISSDRKKLQKLRDELATLVLNTVSGRVVPILGGPLTITGFWLVQQFPNCAPPEYVRSGLEVTDDAISWVSKPLDPAVGDRVQRFMKPVAAALAIKDACVLLLNRQLDRFKSPKGTPPDALEFLHSEKTISLDGDGPGSVNQWKQSGLPPPASDGAQENMRPRTENSKLTRSSIISSLRWLPLPDLGPGSDLYLASTAFKLRLNAYLVRARRTPRRGTFFIAGPVGLKGPHGFCRFEVRGEYDPARSSWVTVDIMLREMSAKRQRAIGG